MEALVPFAIDADQGLFRIRLIDPEQVLELDT